MNSVARLREVLGFILIISMFLLVNSCKNDLEINAPYKADPVVYGLLNPYDSVQYVKIVKSFLGDENPAQYAKISDSSNFKVVDGFVDEYVNGNKVNSYPLKETKITNKSSGTFASPDQVVYSFKTTRIPGTAGYLNPNSEYELRVTIDDEKTITSRTKIIADEPNFFFQRKLRQVLWRKPGNTSNSGNIRFATSTQFLDGLTADAELPVNCKLAEMKMIFYYNEITRIEGGGCKEELKTIEYNMGREVVSDPTKINEVSFTLSAERFYEKIKAGMPDAEDVPNFFTRIPVKCDFEIVMGDDDFYSYIQVTQPSDNLNQNKPQFTNVDGGFGIFGSRVISRLSQQTLRVAYEDFSGLLDSHTQAELITGKLGGGTAAKGFCMDPEIAAGSSYGPLKCAICK